MSQPTFQGSRTRHGTNSGWRKHQSLGETPCDACWKAKSDYDKRRLQATDQQIKNRKYAKAQNRALMKLKDLYPDAYRDFYEEAKAELMKEEQ